jgi:hypothetical protein
VAGGSGTRHGGGGGGAGENTIMLVRSSGIALECLDEQAGRLAGFF